MTSFDYHSGDGQDVALAREGTMLKQHATEDATEGDQRNNQWLTISTLRLSSRGVRV